MANRRVSLEDRIGALAEYLDCDVSEISERGDWYCDVPLLSRDGDEYTVLVDDERDEVVEEDIVSICEDCGVPEQFLSDNYMNAYWVTDFLREEAEYLYSDADDDYAKDLLDQYKISYDEDNFDKDDYLDDFIDEFESKTFASDRLEEIYGKRWGDEILGRGWKERQQNFNLIFDSGKITDDSIACSGYGNFLSSYDGCEDEVDFDGTTYYIYRQS